MALTYQSGEDIQLGDRVTYAGSAGTIELVVEGLTGDPERDRLFETNGAGIMVAEPKVFAQLKALSSTFDLDTPLKEILHKDQWPLVWEAIRNEVGQTRMARHPSRGRAC